MLYYLTSKITFLETIHIVYVALAYTTLQYSASTIQLKIKILKYLYHLIYFWNSNSPFFSLDPCFDSVFVKSYHNILFVKEREGRIRNNRVYQTHLTNKIWITHCTNYLA